MVNIEELRDLKVFVKNIPDDIKANLKNLATSLGINLQNEQQKIEYLTRFQAIFFSPDLAHIKEPDARYRGAWVLFAKDYFITGGGGVDTLIRPYFIGSPKKVTTKSGEERTVTECYGKALNLSIDNATEYYVVMLFWGDNALIASDTLEEDKEYKTKMIWKINQQTNEVVLSSPMNVVLNFEMQNQPKLQSKQQFIDEILQNANALIPNLQRLTDPAYREHFMSSSRTDIKVIPNATILSASKVDRLNMAVLNIIDDSLVLSEDKKTFTVWADPKILNQFYDGTKAHFIGEIAQSKDGSLTMRRLHLLVPIIPVPPPKVAVFGQSEMEVVDLSKVEEEKPQVISLAPSGEESNTPPEKHEVQMEEIEETDEDFF